VEERAEEKKKKKKKTIEGIYWRMLTSTWFLKGKE